MSEGQGIIDAHQHFWQLSRGDYNWLTADFPGLYKDFLPEDLQPTLAKLAIDGTILVQAAPTVAETEFLLNLANNHDFVLGVVGWVDMASSTAPAMIARLKQNKYFCGIRPMIQDIPDIDWMLDVKLDPAFEKLLALGLTFDALVYPQHLKNLMLLIKRYPDLKLVIDHAAKPQIADDAFQPWADDIQMIAENSTTRCKLSGLVTEAGKDWTIDNLVPYIDHVMNCFGPERVMWGSDWPVINLAADYQQWFELCYQYITCNFPKYVNNIFAGVAASFYMAD